MKTAVLFSGQGAQYSGMGKDLYDNFAEVRNIFKQADESLGFSISNICFDEAEKEKLNNTEFCQPAILTLSTACYELFIKAGLKADYFAGFSLGEYSAITNSNAIKFSDAVKLVKQRGKFMNEATTSGQGGMSAVLGMESDKLEEICNQVSEFGYVVCANYNTPGQIVISGETKALEKAEQVIKENKGKVVRLNVSGPFHTKMMSEASQKLEKELSIIEIKDLEIPVVSNINANIIANKNDIIPTLLEQIVSSVMWEQSVRFLIEQGVDTFVEVGPGKTLSAFLKKINRDVKILNIEDVKSYEKTITKLL